jgi:OOP family OmpA-OmpF porin
MRRREGLMSERGKRLGGVRMRSALVALTWLSCARPTLSAAQSNAESVLQPSDALQTSAPPGANTTAPAVENAAPPPSAASTTLPPSAAGADNPYVAPFDSAPSRSSPGDVAHDPHAQNSWSGSSGGVHMIDGSSGEVGSLRLQLGLNFFSAHDFLVPGDKDQALSGQLSMSATPIEHLELFGSLRSHGNSNSRGSPELLQVDGDVTLGAKVHTSIEPWLGLGAEARLIFLNAVGQLGPALAATSLGLRAAATADLRYLSAPIPLILRGNLGYLLDNSSQLIAATEDARYAALPLAMRRDRANEDRQLISRIERFALGINRVDQLDLALGAEAPLRVAEDFYVQPLLEWELGIPINRQAFNCLAVNTPATIAAVDGCLAITGISAAPSSLTLGARILPPVRGLSALIAFDIGLLGTSHFVRELAPNQPWALIAMVGYSFDTRTPKPEIRYLQPVAAATPAAPASGTRRIRGVVVERGSGSPIVGAVVHYGGPQWNPQLTEANGLFTSYELPPGPLALEISHPDYDAGSCSVTVPEPAAEGGGQQAEGFVLARCELVARPRNGSLSGALSDENGNPVASAHIELAGASARSLDAGPAGAFSAQDLPPGEYTARVDARDYLFKLERFSVLAGTNASLPIVLSAKPRVSQVELTNREVKLGMQIMFTPNSAEIEARSSGLLNEILDVLARNPQLKHIEVQGHTDNRGDPAQNLALSQQRAEAVVQWLIQAGIDPTRLEAKGYGDERPIVPNLTADNRMRNRRVQFVIK